MRLVVLHVDGLRCTKVGLLDYRPTYSKKCLHCLKAALVFGRRATYSVPGIPQFAAHQLKLLSGRCAESHPAKQPSTIKNARKEFTIINDRDEFYTDEAVRARFATVNFLTYVVLAHPLGQSAMRHDKFN